MTGNTDKLLRAFIEASGFDIEEVVTNRRMVSVDSIDKCGEIMEGATINTLTTVDYKVTKKVTTLHCDKCNRDINPMGNQ